MIEELDFTREGEEISFNFKGYLIMAEALYITAEAAKIEGLPVNKADYLDFQPTDGSTPPKKYFFHDICLCVIGPQGQESKYDDLNELVENAYQMKGTSQRCNFALPTQEAIDELEDKCVLDLEEGAAYIKKPIKGRTRATLLRKLFN